MRMLLLALACCLVFGCQAQTAPRTVEDPEGEATRLAKARAQAPLAELLDQLAVNPQVRWSEVPYEDDRLVMLELSLDETEVLGEWRVSGQTVTPSNQFARDLEKLAAGAGRASLMALVPGEWLPELPEVAAATSPAPTPPPVQAEAEPLSTQPAERPQKAPPPPAPKLVGVISGDVNTALFQVGERYTTLKPGETSGDLKLISVAPQKAVVVHRGQRREMALEVPLGSVMSAPAPEPVVAESRPESETVYLDNSSLDNEPGVELPGGWTRFDTGE